MLEIRERKQALQTLVDQKYQELIDTYDLKALALTGSLARDLVWVGSDLDFWGFADDLETDFADGVEDGIYWEIDIAPMAVLDIEMDSETWLNPPSFRDDTITLLEALHGCRILYDPDARLQRIQQAIDVRLSDADWLRERARRYVGYARDVLDGVQLVPPVEAILYAREIATNYAIGAYWMYRGRLLTSAIRIPERLADTPDVQALYCDIFALGGQASLDQFMRHFTALPVEIQADLHSDVYNEALPAAEVGAVNGGLRYLRSIMMEQALEYGLLETVYPCLGLDDDIEAHQKWVFDQCHHLLELVEKQLTG